MNSFKIVSITHKLAPLELIGKLHLDEKKQQEKLIKLKHELNIKELMFLSTCNRVEFLLVTETEVNIHFLNSIFQFINPELESQDLTSLQDCIMLYEDDKALTHLFEVASSLDSLVIGEREIITQVRKAYELCKEFNLTGDVIRLAIKHTIEISKHIFTNTNIAKNPVSIASLAYRQLRNLGIKNNARIIFIGAGETNTLMAQYLKKHQYANFTVFNRSIKNAQKLASQLNGTAFELNQLQDFKDGFDVIIACTSSQEPTLTHSIYQLLNNNETTKKVIIDLGLPADVDKSITDTIELSYIDIESLKKQAAENLHKRVGEIEVCKTIINNKVEAFKQLFQQRKIELAFSDIPKQIKTIKQTALNEVFIKEFNSLDDNSKVVLDKVLCYMEKKYNALAIKTAKRVFLEEEILDKKYN